MEIFASEININRSSDGEKKIVVRLENKGGWSSESRIDASVILPADSLQGVNILDDSQVELIARKTLAKELYDESKIIKPEENTDSGYWEDLETRVLKRLNVEGKEDKQTIKSDELLSVLKGIQTSVKEEFDVNDEQFDKAFETLPSILSEEGEETEITHDRMVDFIHDVKDLVKEDD